MIPDPKNQMPTRIAFLFRGGRADEDSSTARTILSRQVREEILSSGDLTVVRPY